MGLYEMPLSMPLLCFGMVSKGPYGWYYVGEEDIMCLGVVAILSLNVFEVLKCGGRYSVGWTMDGLPTNVCVVPWVSMLLLLYALFNHPRRESMFSGSRNLSSRIVLTCLSHKLS